MKYTLMKKRKSYVRSYAVVGGILFLGFLGVAVRTLDQKYPFGWALVADQFRHKLAPIEGPRHILFLYVDHFEPHDPATMDRWMKLYPKAALQHKDADGRPPKHTAFWYFAKSKEDEKRVFLRQLSELAYEGLGETELHLHHWDDTEQTFLKIMNNMIGLSQETGAMITAEASPRRAFGFIHGMWGLDNSRGAGACGVNNEISLLRELNCYGDFTMGAWGPMQARTVNRLYYATDDPRLPKSYDDGPEMETNKLGVGDLLIFEGPIVLRRHGLRPVYDHADVTQEDWPTPERIRKWIETDIHVKGRPEWIFVKAFTHGVVPGDEDAVLGKGFHALHSFLEQNYNDGKRYVLHYVSAREAYNIAKAAEAGKSGNPNDYRDFLIPPYVNRYLWVSVPFETLRFEKNGALLEVRAPAGTRVTVRIHADDVKVSGDISEGRVTAKTGEQVLEFTTLKENARVAVQFAKAHVV